MIIATCPGQGAQTPGFLTPWLADPDLAEQLRELSEISGVDLRRHGTESDANTIRDTSIAQPLIVAAGLLSLRALGKEARAKIGGFAGHSVGEITAGIAAGVFSEKDGMALVAERGRAMAAAAADTETGMSAVLGADPEQLDAALAAHSLAPANVNGAGQVVAAGSLSDLGALAESPPRGARVIPLQVAGAFHTRYMAPAAERLASVAAQVPSNNPTTRLWTNRDGSIVSSGPNFLSLLVGQISSPVRWDLCMESFSSRGVTGLIELCPAGALTGLAKRALRGIPTVAIKTPEDLPAAMALLETVSE